MLTIGLCFRGVDLGRGRCGNQSFVRIPSTRVEETHCLSQVAANGRFSYKVRVHRASVGFAFLVQALCSMSLTFFTFPVHSLLT